MVIIDGDFKTTLDVTGIEIILNWNKHKLFGFQKTIREDKINEMVYQLNNGFQLPIINIIKTDNRTFYMPFLIDSKTGKPDGGHHRAYTHYLNNQNMKCRLISKKYLNIYSNFEIKNMTYK